VVVFVFTKYIPVFNWDKSNVICFYDKLSEIVSKGLEVPKQHKEKNLLRLENRLMKRVSKQLLIEDLRLYQLSNPNIITKLNNYYTKSFLSIEKAPTMESSFNICTPKQFMIYLAQLQASYLGEKALLSLVEGFKPNCKNAMAYKRMKDEASGLLQHSFDADITLINELTAKFDLRVP